MVANQNGLQLKKELVKILMDWQPCLTYQNLWWFGYQWWNCAFYNQPIDCMGVFAKPTGAANAWWTGITFLPRARLIAGLLLGQQDGGLEEGALSMLLLQLVKEALWVERLGLCCHNNQFSLGGWCQNGLGKFLRLPCQCQNHDGHERESPWCDLEEMTKRLKSSLLSSFFCNYGLKI